jgi:hypothetical protein
LFSATYADEVDAILNDYFDPQRLLFRLLELPLENIQQVAYNAPNFSHENKSIETLVTKRKT